MFKKLGNIIQKSFGLVPNAPTPGPDVQIAVRIIENRILLQMNTKTSQLWLNKEQALSLVEAVATHIGQLKK